jgi:hypothetical protein
MIKNDAVEKLAESIAAECGTTPDLLVDRLSQSRPPSADSEFLDRPVRDAWPLLPLEARLIANLLARDRAADDTRRGESSG